ncbi:MAG: hypothetical protein J2P25_00005, partial [Nocardiopsaceae bacterium]|nr:hypothetical protein [Nocardiopsaceae bacterium]
EWDPGPAVCLGAGRRVCAGPVGEGDGPPGALPVGCGEGAGAGDRPGVGSSDRTGFGSGSLI